MGLEEDTDPSVLGGWGVLESDWNEDFGVKLCFDLVFNRLKGKINE